MKVKIIFVISFIIILNIFANAYCKDNNSIQPSFVDEISSDKLKATKITPVMDEKINTGENLIYCSTFQMVWNEMCNKFAKGTLEVSSAPEYVSKLNALYKQPALLDKESYIAMSGFGKENIVNKINETVKKRFGHLQSDELPPVFDYKLEPNEILAFSYLYKNLEYPEVFEKTEPLLMNVNNNSFYVETFGISGLDESNTDKLCEQVNIKYFNDKTDEVNRPNGVILSLKTKSETDEIIISTIPVSSNLYGSYIKIQETLKQNQNFKLPSHCKLGSLKIPKLNFNILHEYKDLIPKEVLNKSLKKYMPHSYIKIALQKIAFNFNEKGAKLASLALLGKLGSGTTHISITIKYPFIIYLKNKTFDMPYFMSYVDNYEIMVKYVPDECDKFGKFDKDFALNPILKHMKNSLDIEIHHIEEREKYINDKSEDGSTTLLLAIKKKEFLHSRFYQRVKEFYHTEDSLENNLHANGYYLGLIEKLIKLKADINASDNFGNSPLTCAVENNDFEIVKLLIDSGADIKAKRKDSKDALTIAKDKKFEKIIELIESKQVKK